MGIDLNGELQSLHGDKKGEDDVRRDTILVVEKDPAVRELLARLLRDIFTSFDVRDIEDPAEAVEAIKGLLNERLALLITETDGNVVLSSLEDTDLDIKLGKVPRVLITTDEGRGNPDKLIDGTLIKPLIAPVFERVLSEAVLRRASLFEEMEQALRPQVIREFLDFYKDLAKSWRSQISGITTAQTEDIEAVASGIERFSNGLKELEECGGEEIETSKLQIVVHDFNNALTAMISYPDFILSGELSQSDRKVIELFLNEAHQLHRHIKAISAAYNKRATWSQAKTARLTLQIRERLEFPKGTAFCVIDDDESNRNVASRIVRDSGGEAYTASDEESLKTLFGELTGKVDVFLLDNDLGEGNFGHKLISLIRDKFPDALIIAHTGDAVKINETPGNPYENARVAVVGKREWNSISYIIKTNAEKSLGK